MPSTTVSAERESKKKLSVRAAAELWFITNEPVMAPVPLIVSEDVAEPVILPEANEGGKAILPLKVKELVPIDKVPLL